MPRRLLTSFVRVCLGILIILNGPANVLAIGLNSTYTTCSCAAANSDSSRPSKASRKKCCGRCFRGALAQSKEESGPDKIRPTCPVCPSCPNYPGGCCVSCPSKAPCAPPLIFVIPESSELSWHLADDDISFADSHGEEPLLPPRFCQFVALTI